MQSSRRSFLRGVASVAGVASAQTAYAQHAHPAPTAQPSQPAPPAAPVPPYEFGSGIVPLVSPDVRNMPWRLENGVKVFDIRVEHVRTDLIPGRAMDGWGFNGSIPGPTIQVTEGDRVHLNVENRLPEPFSIHWHGLEIPNDMDGMPGNSQVAGSCTTPMPLTDLIACRPSMPSSSIPESSTPIARAPWWRAAVRNKGSMAGRYPFSRGPRVS